MRTQKDRDEFIALMAREGVAVEVARALLRAGATLHRLAELECSSEAADRDRVPCPAAGKPRPREGKAGRASSLCLCEHWGSSDGQRGCGCADWQRPDQHHKVTRISVQEQRIRRRVNALCALAGLSARFGGDPRGAVLAVAVPSGKSTGWGADGIVVA